MKTSLAILSCAALILATPALSQETPAGEGIAEATVIDTEGVEIGTVTLTETADGVHIAGTLTGIPAGEHGFHIHETGDCDSAGGFQSAGGHFAEAGDHHGAAHGEGDQHAGDMPNLVATADGQLVLDVTNEEVSLTQGDDGYLFDDDGSAMVIHAAPDDYQSAPSGNAGERIACGVIEAARP